MNESEERFESWRQSRRAGLALFAIGAILVLLGRYNPSLALVFVIYPLLSFAFSSQVPIASELSYILAFSVSIALMVLGTIKYYSARSGPAQEVDNEIVITCISDNEHFADEVSRYLYDDLTNHNQNEPDDVFEIDSDTFVLDGNEIHVSKESPVPKEVIKIILETLLNSDPEKFHDYMVIEFGDTITIGRAVMGYSVEGMFVCEICGYFTPYEGEVPSHRLTHLRV